MSCCIHNNVNRYSNNGGGSSTMRKKLGSKFSKTTSAGQFSLNGINNNNIYNNVGNPNNAISYVGCKTYDNKIKTSVKNTKGHINNKLFNSSVNSFDCYKNSNKELIDLDKNGLPLNKHFNANNKDQSTRTQILKSRCSLDRSNYKEHLKTLHENNNKSCPRLHIGNINRIQSLTKKCNITKDLQEVNAYIPGYDIYFITKKKGCNYNPPDAKVIAC